MDISTISAIATKSNDLGSTLNQIVVAKQVLCENKDLINLLIAPLAAILGTVIGSFSSLFIEKLKRKFNLDDRDENRKFKVYGELNGFIFATKQLYTSRFEALIFSDYHEKRWQLGGFKDDSIDLSESKRWMIISEDYVKSIIENHKKLHKCLARISLLYKNSTSVNDAVKKIINSKNPNILKIPTQIDVLTIEKWKIDAREKLNLEVNQKIGIPIANLIEILDKLETNSCQ